MNKHEHSSKHVENHLVVKIVTSHDSDVMRTISFVEISNVTDLKLYFNPVYNTCNMSRGVANETLIRKNEN